MQEGRSTILEFNHYQPEIQGRKLFAPLSFSLSRKDFLILRAPSGTGKTKWLEDIVYGRSSAIKFNGSFSYLPQSLDLVKNLSVIKNAILPYVARLPWWQTLWVNKNKIPLSTVEKNLVELGLPDFDKSTLYLSGGEQQRLAVIRTVHSQKDLWILDEPISQLDPEWALKVFEFIYAESRKAQATVICVLHQDLKIPHLTDIKTLTWNDGWSWDKK